MRDVGRDQSGGVNESTDPFAAVLGSLRGAGLPAPARKCDMLAPALAARLHAYESDELSPEECVELFQALIDTGGAWILPASYGRQAMQLIQEGWCALGEHPRLDAYDNRVPSRREVVEGTPGSRSYLRCSRRGSGGSGRTMSAPKTTPPC
jgi:hypothetical protein